MTCWLGIGWRKTVVDTVNLVADAVVAVAVVDTVTPAMVGGRASRAVIVVSDVYTLTLAKVDG